MKISVETQDVTAVATPALVVNLFSGVTAPGGATGAVDAALDGVISRLIAEGEIKGKLGDVTLLHTMGRIAPERVAVVGLGKRADFDLDAARRVSGEVLRFLRGRGIGRAATVTHGAGIGGLSPRAAGRAVAEGSLLGLYRFDRYHSKNGGDGDGDGGNGGEFAELTIVERDESRAQAIRDGAAEGRGDGGIRDDRPRSGE